jgi:uncharacterized protein (TIGR01777 family)
VKKIGVTGASGFIGRALVAALARRGDAVRAFTRRPGATGFPANVEAYRLDLRNAPVAEIAGAVSGLDGVVHLAGETVSGHWSEAKKREIQESRELTTRNLVTGMWESAAKPPVLVAASAAGYYGSRGDEPLDEDSPPGSGFLARVCVDWEREAHVAEEFGTRVVCLRQGLVLGKDGGALPRMLAPFRMGVGGALGMGRQWWPWIHVEDAVEMLLFALDREDVAGAVNAVAPDPATNARFSLALAHALGRPSLFAVPGPALRIVLGEFAGVLLSSQLMLPAVAQDAGFAWKHPHLEEALLDLLGDSKRTPAVQHFEHEVRIGAPVARVFEFFSDASNLKELEPPKRRLEVLTPAHQRVQRGTTLELRVRVGGVPVRWKTLITKWKPEQEFEDIALRGPFLLWRHRHAFAPDGAGTTVRDSIDYVLRFAPFSNLILPAARRDLNEMFRFRNVLLKEIFGS